MKHTTEIIELSNGAKGLLINIPGATVMSYDFELRAGHYLVEERKKWEVPHIMEHLMLGANSKYKDMRSFNADFQKNGAYSNASTDTVSIHYFAECADFEWQRILRLMLLGVSKPKFLKKEFDAECGNVRDELVSGTNNEFRRLSLAFSEALGLSVVREEERIEQMNNKDVSLADVVKFYEDTHSTDNFRFVIAGKIRGRKTKIVEMLESQLKLPRGERFDYPEETPVGLKKPHVMVDTSISNMYFFLETFVSKRLNTKERYALGLLNTMLTTGLHSLILGEARSKGYVYHIDSGTSLLKDFSGWWFGAQVTVDKSEAVFEIIHKHLNKVLKGQIKQEDIDAAKKFRLGGHQLATQKVSQIAGYYQGRFYYKGSVIDLDTVAKHIKSVEKKDIVKIARELFAEDNWGLGTLGSADEKHAKKLEKIVKPLWTE